MTLNLKSLSGSGVEQLCPNCGLCCDGTLFADVELRKSDSAKWLKALGLSPFSKSKTKVAFPQSCACFSGTLCNIYGDRPKHCRLFECGLLKRVNAGEITATAALKKIRKTKEMTNSLRALLKELGQSDEMMAISERYADVMCQPIDLSNEKNGSRQRGKLMTQMDRLMRILHSDFLTR